MTIMASSSTTRRDLGSSLLQVPTEIRQAISELVLVVDSPYITPTRQNRPERIVRRTRSGRQFNPNEEGDDDERYNGHSAIALMMTCRQLYNEGYRLYYQKNEFAFGNAFVLNSFLSEIGPECSAEIRGLVIFCSAGHSYLRHRGTSTNIWHFTTVIESAGLKPLTITMELCWGQQLDDLEIEELQELKSLGAEIVKEIKIRRPETSSRHSGSRRSRAQIGRPATSPERESCSIEDCAVELVVNRSSLSGDTTAQGGTDE